MSEEHPAVVIDNGSSNCKAGFAGDDAPSSCYPKFKVFYHYMHLGELQVLLLTVERILHTQCQYMKRINIAGNACTKYLALLLNELGIEFESSAEMEIVRDMKKKLGYVALDFEDEMKKYQESVSNNKQYELPDGKVLTIEDQRFRCAELLFKPSLIEKETLSIHKMASESINQCPIDVRRDLYGNIVLSGSTTMFPGLPERLSKEVTSLASPSMKIKVVAPPERKFSVWIGGSIVALSSLSKFQDKWIDLKEYKEYGPQIVHRKCQI